jgi:hypothetical protein
MFLKRNQGLWVKVIVVYIFFSIASDSALLRLDALKHQGVIYKLLSAYTIVEYSAFTFVLYSVIENKIFRIIIVAASIIFYAFALLYYITVENFSFDSLPASIEAILIVAFSIFYLFDQMNKPQVIFIYQEPSFWFVVGFIIYFSGALFLFIQASNLDRDIRDNFWKINLFLTVTKNILFAIAFSTRKSNNLHFPEENPFEHDIFENPYKT